MRHGSGSHQTMSRCQGAYRSRTGPRGSVSAASSRPSRLHSTECGSGTGEPRCEGQPRGERQIEERTGRMTSARLHIATQNVQIANVCWHPGSPLFARYRWTRPCAVKRSWLVRTVDCTRGCDAGEPTSGINSALASRPWRRDTSFAGVLLTRPDPELSAAPGAEDAAEHRRALDLRQHSQSMEPSAATRAAVCALLVCALLMIA